ncbi:hypothetical protein QAD02_005768 [Eretmocerus hayati]|uniref:Uncharacterized protein n=1 Tax=Eretmocerus hayati TaxID=131215 RepID=A0ACC2NUI9_9HYME|nr:hypothetical protein QAD02_005768 [Eretmocerus hayati]
MAELSVARVICVDFVRDVSSPHAADTVPPLKPIIYDTKRRDMSEHLEAYPEGADLDLICEVHGGKPIPRVMWYLESQIINSSYEVKEMENPANIAHLPTAGMAKVPSTVIISRVKIKNLKRTHHRAKLSCRASNTNLAIPQTTTVIIELIMKPLEVLILSKEKVVSASKRYEITCRSSGSKPPASLSWYKGSKRLENSSRDFQEEGRSMSVLSWKPNAEDDGKYLTCRAENRRLPEATIEDKWKLKVHFAPIVQLRIGSTIGSRDIREGSDVSFECNVRSNPRNFKLTWYHGVNIKPALYMDTLHYPSTHLFPQLHTNTC